MKVVLLGAGATIGTFGDSLGVDGFVGRLNAVDRRMGKPWCVRYPDLARAVHDCGSVNLDRIWTHIDYTAKLRRSLCVRQDCPSRPPCSAVDCGAPDYGDVSGQLRNALLDAYSLETETADLIATGQPFTLKRILDALEGGDVLISFNWDVVAERTLASLRPTLKVVAASRQCLRSDALNLIKPHGSLSWEDRGAGKGVFWDEGGSPRPDPMRRTGFEHPQPFILGAVPIKDELLAGTQKDNPEIFETIGDQWAAVVNAVSLAKQLVIVGYGFPPEDGYGRFLFRAAAGRRTDSARGLRIEFYSRAEDTSTIEGALRDIFGKSITYTYQGTVTGPGKGAA